MVESDASTLLERLRPWGLSSFPLEREKTENEKKYPRSEVVVK